MRKESQGITWLEIIVLIVVVVLVAGIVVPNLWKSKSDINQASAVRSLRMITNAEANYATSYDTGFSQTLATLGPPPDAAPNASLAGYIDSELSSGNKEGYNFTYAAGPADANGRIQSYTLTADPVNSSTGAVHYYVDQTGVVRENSQQAATDKDKPVGG
jgi:type II secretory pathway pseudopilin PulG